MLNFKPNRLEENTLTTQQKIMHRRQRLVALKATLTKFSATAAAKELHVSRFTVMSDLAFLRKHSLLGIRRNPIFPFEALESGEEFMRRFQAAHRA